MILQKRKLRKENNYTVSNGIVIVELSKGYYVELEESDWEKLRQHRWYALTVKCKDGRILVYPATTMTKLDGKSKIVLMHRLIMGDPEGLDVDHRDLNTLNCRRENLRACTRSQNLTNSGKRKGTKTGEKYITMNHNSYAVKMVRNKKLLYFGTFKTLKEAIEQRDRTIKYMIGSRFYRTEGQAYAVSGCNQ